MKIIIPFVLVSFVIGVIAMIAVTPSAPPREPYQINGSEQRYQRVTIPLDGQQYKVQIANEHESKMCSWRCE